MQRAGDVYNDYGGGAPFSDMDLISDTGSSVQSGMAMRSGMVHESKIITEMALLISWIC